MWIRLKLEESPAFAKIRDEGTRSQAPFRKSFFRWNNLKIVLIALVGILTGQGVVWYTAQFYTQFFLERIIAVQPATVNWLMMIVTVISIPLYLFFGWLSDRIGRKPVMLLGLGMAAVGFIPGFQMLTDAANPALARANAHAPVVVVAAPKDCSLQFDLIGKAKFVTGCDIAKSALTNAGVAYTNEAAPAGTPAQVRVGTRRRRQHGRARHERRRARRCAQGIRNAVEGALAQEGYPLAAAPGAIDTTRVLLILLYFIVAATALYGPQAAALVELFPVRIRYTALSVPYHIGVGWFGGFLPATAFAIVAATGNIYAGLWYPVIVAGIGFFVTLFFLPETYRRIPSRIRRRPSRAVAGDGANRPRTSAATAATAPKISTYQPGRSPATKVKFAANTFMPSTGVKQRIAGRLARHRQRRGAEREPASASGRAATRGLASPQHRAIAHQPEEQAGEDRGLGHHELGLDEVMDQRQRTPRNRRRDAGSAQRLAPSRRIMASVEVAASAARIRSADKPDRQIEAQHDLACRPWRDRNSAARHRR